MRPADLRKLSLPTSRIILPRLKPLFYLFKVVVLPQAVTAGTLYMILLYLLKDRDLLDAQRNRFGRNELPRDSDDEDGLVGKGRGLKGVRVHLLPCSHEADIGHIASNVDGTVVLTVGIDNSLCLWRFTGSSGSGTREALKDGSLGQDDAIACAALSSDGRTILVMTEEGILHQWYLAPNEPPLSKGSLDLEIRGAIEMRLLEVQSGSEDPFLVRPSSPVAEEVKLNILVMTSQASVVSISPTMAKTTVIPVPDIPTRAVFLAIEGASNPGIGILVINQDKVTLYLQLDSDWVDVVIPTTSGTRVMAASLTASNLALGYHSGLIEVYDLTGAPVIAVGTISTPASGHSPPVGGVIKMSLACTASSSCITCGLVSTDSTFIISSTAERIVVDRINMRGNIPCRCRRGSLLDELKYPVLGATGSPAKLVIPPAAHRGGFSPGASPKKSPSLLPPVSNGEFPLSSHGTRRLSALHRDDVSSPVMGPGAMTSAMNSPDSDLEVMPMGAVLAPGGESTWCVSNDVLLGLRRVGGGIDDSQWELWSVDLRAPWNGSSLVVDTAPMTSLLRKGANTPFTSVHAQRTERLLSLSGRAPFPSLGASFSVETFAPLAYTEIRPFHRVTMSSIPTSGAMLAKDSAGKIVIGLGNRIGVVSIPEGKGLRHQTSQSQLSSMGAGIGLSGVGLGVTPPPPSMRREMGLEKKTL